MTLKNISQKTYALGLLVSGILIAVIGMLTIWMPDVDKTVIIKSLFSIAVIGSLSFFLFLLSHNEEKGWIKNMGSAVAIVAVAFAVLVLGHLWFSWFEGIMLGKMLGTFVLVGGVLGFGIAIFVDFFDDHKMKKDNYLD